jgi:hypothetical protein
MWTCRQMAAVCSSETSVFTQDPTSPHSVIIQKTNIDTLNYVSPSTNKITEDDCLLECCAMQSSRRLPTFQRCLMPPSSSPWWWPIRAMIMEAVSISETSVNFYQTTRLNIPEDKSPSYSPPQEPEISTKQCCFATAGNSISHDHVQNTLTSECWPQYWHGTMSSSALPAMPQLTVRTMSTVIVPWYTSVKIKWHRSKQPHDMGSGLSSDLNRHSAWKCSVKPAPVMTHPAPHLRDPDTKQHMRPGDRKQGKVILLPQATMPWRCMGKWRYTSCISASTVRGGGVNGYFHAPAASPQGKSLRSQRIGDWAKHKVDLDSVMKKRIPVPTENRTLAVQPVTSPFTNWAIKDHVVIITIKIA